MPEWDNASPLPDRKSDPKLWLWTVTISTFLAIAIASRWMSGPIIHADEGGYLLNAATIAGKLHASAILGSYYSGYSLLLAPAWVLFSDPAQIYHACLIINGLLLATTPAGLYWLLSTIFPHSLPRTRLLASLAGAWQASVLALSQLALSESALIAAYVWSLALVARALQLRSKSAALSAGAMIGYLFLIHPRGLLLGVPVLAVVLTHALKSRVSLNWISGLIAGALILAALHWPLELLAGKHGTPQGANYDIERLTRELLDSFKWSRFAADLVGVLVYAFASSATFVALGMRKSRFMEDRNLATSVISQGSCLAFLACAVTTAVFFVDGHRIDYVIYGRYITPAMVPLTACGAVNFLEASRRRWVPAVGTLLLIALLIWMFGHLLLPIRTRWMPENVIGLYPAFVLVKGVYPVAVGVYFVAFFAIIEIARLHSSSTAIACFILINLAIVGAFIAFQLRPEGERRDQDRVLVRAIAEIQTKHKEPLCLYISPSLDIWHIVDYRFWLYRNLPQAVGDRVHCIHMAIAPLSPGPPGAWRLAAEAQAGSTGLFISLDDPRPFENAPAEPPSIIRALPEGSH